MAVTDLGAEVRRLDARERRTKRVAAIAFAGLVVDLVLSAVVITGGLVLGGQVDRQDELVAQNAATIRQLQATNTRLETSVQESCSFYALVLGSYRPESRPEGPDRDTYKANFERMRQSYRNLECQGPIVAPAVPTPPR